VSSIAQRGSEHTVQFYESDVSLVDTLSALITGSFEDGKRVIVLATASHRRDIEKSLVASGVDIGAARRRNQYIDLEAAQVLSRILANAEPDAARFARVVGGLITDTPPEYRGVWVFGEMVAMLWNQRMYESSLRLEALWNEIPRKYDCTLYCAYPAEFACYGNGRYVRPVSPECARFVSPENRELTSFMQRGLRAIERFRERIGLRGEQERAQVESERRSSEALRDFS
jgi:hypothetical protein